MEPLEQEVADSDRYPRKFSISPNGRSAFFVSGDRASVTVLDLATKKVARINFEKYSAVVWSGDRLLMTGREGGQVEARDVNGGLLEKLELRAYLFASDSTGTRLLAYANKDTPTKDSEDSLWDRDLVVVSPQGKVLRVVAEMRNACDKDEPRLSRNGAYAGVYCQTEETSDDWAYSVISMVTEESLRLERTVGNTMALTENGDSIVDVNYDDGPMRVGFWSKDDDWLNQPQANFSSLVWDEGHWTVVGRILQLNDPVLMATVLGDELFTVECPDGKPMVKAYELPTRKTEKK